MINSYRRSWKGLSALNRFIYNTRPRPDGCWEWIGAKRRRGYGVIRDLGKSVPSHRWAYEQWFGPIPEAKQAHHVCRITSCVNPYHLGIVTQQTNILRGDGISAKAARATHCPQGHAYDLLNTKITPKGFRVCRECHRQRCARDRLKWKKKE